MTRRRPPGRPVDRTDVHRIVQDDLLLTRIAQGPMSVQWELQREPSVPQEPSVRQESSVDAAATAAGTGGSPVPSIDALLSDWRSAALAQQFPPPPSAKAISRAARAAGLSAPARSSSFRAAVGIVASAAFLLSGTAIAGARSAQPGDVLWPVTRTFWADRADATLAERDINAALGRATAALAAGDRQGARQALDSAAAALPRIPGEARGALLARLDLMTAGVGQGGPDRPEPPVGQAAASLGTPPVVPGPAARPGVPVGPVTSSSSDGLGDADASGAANAPGPGSDPVSVDDPNATPGSGSEQSGAGATGDPSSAGPSSTRSTSSTGAPVPPGGSGPTTASSGDRPTTTTASGTSTASGASTPGTTTGTSTSPSTTGPSTTRPGTTTSPSAGSSTTGPPAGSTPTSTPAPTSPSTSAPDGTTAPSTTGAIVTSQAVPAPAIPTPTTPSRRTTQSPPGFAPPPSTTAAVRTTRAAPTTSVSVAR